MHSDNTSSAPVMFCHDDRTIFYPSAPGRVYSIDFSALGDCDGSDQDYSDSTGTGDICDMVVFSSKGVGLHRDLCPLTFEGAAPAGWRGEGFDDDLRDAVEMWADWCDRDAARLDSLDGPAPDADAAGILARLRSIVVGRAAIGSVTPAPPKRDGLGQELIDDAKYYIQDKRSIVGNCASWWRAGGGGYTCELGEAGPYTGKYCRGLRDTDIPWPASLVADIAVQHVRVEALGRARDAALRTGGGPPGRAKSSA